MNANVQEIISHIKPGQHYGESTLLGHGTTHISAMSTAKHHKTTIMTLTRAQFLKIKIGKVSLSEKVFARAEELEREHASKVEDEG